MGVSTLIPDRAASRIAIAAIALFALTIGTAGVGTVAAFHGGAEEVDINITDFNYKLNDMSIWLTNDGADGTTEVGTFGVQNNHERSVTIATGGIRHVVFDVGWCFYGGAYAGGDMEFC